MGEGTEAAASLLPQRRSEGRGGLLPPLRLARQGPLPGAPGGRAAVIVPDGVLELYAGVSTASLLFTKTSSGGTEDVWFYDCDADGWSLDDKRAPLLSEDRLGPVPATALTAQGHARNNLPDILARWAERAGK